MKKLLLLMIISLFVTTAANAATLWRPAANGIVPPAVGNWNEAANWNNGVPVMVVPGETKGILNQADAAECWVTDDQSLVDLVLGDNGDDESGVLRIVDGGSITTGGGWAGVGFNRSAHMIVEKGGSLTTAGHLWVGLNQDDTVGAPTSVGTLDINGGTVNVGGNFGLGWSTGTGYVNVNSGVLNLDHWGATASIKSGVLDVSFGTVTIGGNREAEALAYAAADKLTGFGGLATPSIVFDSGTNITTITATDPMNRYPTMHQLIDPGPVTLSWTNISSVPPGGSVWVDVWFGKDDGEDPNFVLIVDAGQDVTSAPVTANGAYYWQVDTYVYGDPGVVVYQNHPTDPNAAEGYPIVEGLLMQFTASNDLTPYNVNAGVDMLTWVGQAVPLLGTYNDDAVSPVVVTWSSDNPTAVFAPTNDGGLTSNVVNPTVTVGTNVDVTLTFSVKDTPNPAVSDDMVVYLYEDACDAARNGKGQAANNPEDLVPDCVIDLKDIVKIAIDWVDNYELTAPVPK